jgi:hypothetical protein
VIWVTDIFGLKEYYTEIWDEISLIETVFITDDAGNVADYL